MEPISLLIALFIIFIPLVTFGSVISIYNGIIRRENQAKRAWADVIAYARRKLEVLPNFEKALEEYKEYEQGLLAKITALRVSIGNLSDQNIDPGKMEEVRGKTRSLLQGLNVAVEAYPNLKASDLYQRWMNELSTLEGNITAAISIFNEAVQEFNNSIETFPGSMINGLLNKKRPLQPFTDTKASAEFEYEPGF